MKRIIVLLLAVCCLCVCSSCSPGLTAKDLEPDVYSIEFGKHRGLLFVHSDGQKSIMHDPDCEQCQRQRLIRMFPLPASQPASAPASSVLPGSV